MNGNLHIYKTKLIKYELFPSATVFLFQNWLTYETLGQCLVIKKEILFSK